MNAFSDTGYREWSSRDAFRLHIYLLIEKKIVTNYFTPTIDNIDIGNLLSDDDIGLRPKYVAGLK